MSGNEGMRRSSISRRITASHCSARSARHLGLREVGLEAAKVSINFGPHAIKVLVRIGLSARDALVGLGLDPLDAPISLGLHPVDAGLGIGLQLGNGGFGLHPLLVEEFVGLTLEMVDPRLCFA
jgi:hypothetical protein